MVANTNLKDALTAATESVRLDANDSNLHTKAVVEAELGDLRSAIEDDRKAIELRLLNAPDGNDWYVVGRIAEQMGMREDAISAYKQVKTPPLHTTLVPNTDELARRRLAALGKP